MIQLANDPNASRSGVARYLGQPMPTQAQSRRSSHAWPFPSRYADKPQSLPQSGDKSFDPDSGS